MKIILDTGAQIPVPAEYEQAVQKLVMGMMFPTKKQKRRLYTAPRVAKDWTPEEDEIVRTDFVQGMNSGKKHGVVCEEIGKKLGRTSWSISSRCNRLGLIIHRK